MTLPLALALTVLPAHAQNVPSKQAPGKAKSSAAKPIDPLTHARQLYNDGKYDEAIVAAAQARQTPASAAAAAVVFARAHLERYRQRAETQDLNEARAALIGVDDAALSPREHVELVVGLGESLYFDNRQTAAAELFEVALARSDLLDPPSHDLLFEWWAAALGQQAELGAEVERRALYTRVLVRADEELRRDDRSATAAYWLAAAARGAGQLDRAWGAAIAGWVRAPMAGSRGVKLRADLDRFVAVVLIPERARQLTGVGDAKAAAAKLVQEWEDVKQKYGAGSQVPGSRHIEPGTRNPEPETQPSA